MEELDTPERLVAAAAVVEEVPVGNSVPKPIVSLLMVVLIFVYVHEL